MNAATEAACARSWFANWSGEQRNQFAQRIAKPPQSASADPDDLLASLEKMSVANQEGPGVFECQMRILEKWILTWGPEVRQSFFQALREMDPNFPIET